MPRDYGESVDVGKEGGHASTIAELSFIDEADRVMNRLVVRTDNYGELALSEEIEFLLNSGRQCQRLYLTGDHFRHVSLSLNVCKE